MAHALSGLHRPVAWLSLDGTEQAAGRLLVYLEAAVENGVPSASGVATDALASSIQIGEAAGLLAESLQGSELVLVCDNVERVVDDDGCQTVLAAMARYLPSGVNLVLISRAAVPLDQRQASDITRTGEVGERDLAFRVPEAKEALEALGQQGVDAQLAVAATGGWVTGIVFNSWSVESNSAADAETIRSYLTQNMFNALTADEQSFLMRTSLLDEVTVDGARALGQGNAAQVMASLRTRHLPMSWAADGDRVTPHPIFREYLVSMLEREDEEVLTTLRHQHAKLLLAQGEREAAVDELLRLGDIEGAWHHAAIALPALVARMDFDPAARWLDALRASSRPPTPEIGAVVLRVAFALDDVGRGVEFLDRHGLEWLPGPDTPDFEEAYVLASWCLWHVGRIAEARRLVESMPQGRAKDIAATLVSLASGETPPFPEMSPAPSGPIDGLLIRLAYMRGRLHGLDEPGLFDPWCTIIGGPWVVAGLRAAGRLEEAVAMYELRRDSSRPLWLHASDAVDLMMDLGRGADARASLERGRALLTPTRSLVFANISYLAEAKLNLRLDKDPEAADRALAEAQANHVDDWAFIREWRQVWSGLSHLMQGRDEAAHRELLAAVESMQRGDRRLELTTAAVYLAEAHWRLGHEEDSDAMAELALATAHEQGSHHLLMTALTDMPAVAVRAADSAPGRGSEWHELVDALANWRTLRVSTREPQLVIEEFGNALVTVDGEPAQPRLTKAIELLSYLMATPERSATRQELLGTLFAGRNDAAGRSYLRQALYRLREVLPEHLAPKQDGDVYAVAGPDLMTGTGQMALDLLAQATRQDGETRLQTVTRALDMASRGPFLANLNGEWIQARRSDIEERMNSGRIDAARTAYRICRYGEARDLLEEALRIDPYREQAWQLMISLAFASGSDDAVLRLYQRYVATMRELGVPPSAEVHRIVTQSRR
ncbi:uncharacterized protein PD653_1110 [Nocardioides sp. PD653]|nr:uncharacterized protein PD653B2_0301 [Nocardioides sp. PD653-B2]GAW53707.1 uncharacterized protein PD653_1110 [Nocardioides sp. PD653]